MQKDFTPTNTRYQSGAGAMMYTQRTPSMSSQNMISGQMAYSPPYYFQTQPPQMSQPPNAVPQHPQMPNYMRQPFIPAVQQQVRHDGYNFGSYHQPRYITPSPHGSSIPYPAGLAPTLQPFVYAVRPVVMTPSSTQQYQQSHPAPQSQPQAAPVQTPQPQVTPVNSRPKVVIRDPVSNKDLTQEILGQRSERSSEVRPPNPSVSEDEKSRRERDKIASDFAAQVAARLASDDEGSALEGKHELDSEQSSSITRGRPLSKQKASPISKLATEYAPRILTKQSEASEASKGAELAEVIENKFSTTSHAEAVPETNVKEENSVPTLSDNVTDALKPDTETGRPSVDEDAVVDQLAKNGPCSKSERTKLPEDEDSTSESAIVEEGNLPEETNVSSFQRTAVADVAAGPLVESVVDSSQGSDEPSGALDTKEVTLEGTGEMKNQNSLEGQDLNVAESQQVVDSNICQVEQIQQERPEEVLNTETTYEGNIDPTVNSLDTTSKVESVRSPEDDEVAKNTECTAASGKSSPADADPQNDQGDAKLMNGYDHNAQVGSAFREVPKKKKQKQRIKEISAKGEKSDQNLMSAYVDKPPKNESEAEEHSVQEVEKESKKKDEQGIDLEEEATWEDKEHNLVNEPEAQISPKVTATAIISNEDGTVNESTKLQYDRDFLLKLQFASICTEKPKDLPDIEIVLNKAHEPTKPIIQGQGLGVQCNDFTPHFMRHSGGGPRGSGSRGGKVGRGSAPPAKKIITSTFDTKIELKKAENAWVRPGSKSDTLSEDDKKKDELYRAVRGILNKLTPQKFDKLVDKMVALEIDSSEKLDSVIDLIFQKAISEQSFSEAYAKMCKVLVDKQVSAQDGSNWGNFRKKLLNKCQREFQKEKADENSLMLEREKEFDKPEEKKAWLEEIELKVQKQRMKTLGNIRFIGELFKLGILHENIMHNCIIDLLNSRDEDSLECLCKLLRTIGKNLDVEVAQRRMNQYFQEMNKMATSKKVSSRVRFMLLDVIELRQNKWVPRREGEGPKTIDQIHEEAKIQQQKSIQLAQEEARQRKAQGRESPYPRAPAAAAGEEAWSQVPSKSKPQAVDPSKMRLSKRTDSETISLGPGGRSGSSWAKGAGVGLSRTAAAEPQKQEMNRFSILGDRSSRPVDTKTRGPLRSQYSGKRTPDPRGGMPPAKGLGRDSQRDSPVDVRNEKEKALAAVRQLSNQSSRTPSPSVRLEEGTGSQPSSAPRTPVQSPAETPTPTPPPNVEATKEKIKRETRLTVDEFILTGDEAEAAECIQDLKANQYLSVFVSEGINYVLESKMDRRVKLGKLIHYFIKKDIVSVDSVIEGLNEVMEIAEDLATDVPYIWRYLGEIIGNFCYDGTVPLNRIKESIEPLIQSKKAGKLMAEILSSAVAASSEDQVASQWRSSGLSWKTILRDDENEVQFVEDKKLHYLTKASLPHASQIQEELKRIQEAKGAGGDGAAFSSWIQTNVPEPERTSAEFLRCLTTAICRHCLELDNSKYILNKESFSIYAKELARYVTDEPDRELQVLMAAQKLYVDLQYPPDVLATVFGALYDDEVVSEQTLFTWEGSDQEPHGKRAALSAVKGFFNWLKAPDMEKTQES